MIIDVSEHNGHLNWATLKRRIEGAIIRCGYGQDIKTQDDRQWLYNVGECERLGIKYGVYLYSYAQDTTAARSEAQHVARLLKGHKPGLPVFYDLEESKLTAFARKNFYAFEEALKGSYRIGLYSGEAYYNQCLQGTAASYLWIARYGSDNGKVPSKKPALSDGKKIHLWQYTSKGLGGHTDCSLVLDQSVFAAGTKKKAKKSVTTLAKEVIAGKWGNGADRKKKLEAAGYNYAAVQAEVNRLLK